MLITRCLSLGLLMISITALTLPVSADVPSADASHSAAPVAVEAPPILDQPAVILPAAMTAAPLELVLTPLKLKSHVLSKKYDGYEITLTNRGSHDLTLVDTQFDHCLTGSAAYQKSHKKLIGISSFFGVSGFVTTAIRHQVSNNKARKEGGRFQNAFTPTVLPAGGSMTAYSLTPKKQPPQIHIAAQDSATGARYEVSNNPVDKQDANILPVNYTGPSQSNRHP